MTFWKITVFRPRLKMLNMDIFKLAKIELGRISLMTNSLVHCYNESMKSVEKKSSIKLLCCYGKSLEQGVFFGVDAAAWNSGDSQKMKGLVLKFRGDKIFVEKELPVVITDALQDRSGNTFLLTDKQQLLINSLDISKSEPIGLSEMELGPLALSGSLGKANFRIATCSAERLYLRTNEKWEEISIPEDVDGVNSTLILSPKKILLTAAEGFVQWNNSSFKAFYGVEDEILSLTVIDRAKLLAVGSEGLYIWSAAKKWKTLKSPCDNYCIGSARHDDSVLIPSRQGIVRFDMTAEKLKKISDYSCVQIVPLEEKKAVAFGRDSGYCLMKF